MANSIWVGWLGTTRVTTNGADVVFPGSVTATRYLADNGSVAAPAFAATADPSTGLYFQTNLIRAAVAGANVLQLTSSSMLPFGTVQLGSVDHPYSDGFFSGTLQFGTHSALAAETVTGYITITDAGGVSRKLAVVS